MIDPHFATPPTQEGNHQEPDTDRQDSSFGHRNVRTQEPEKTIPDTPLPSCGTDHYRYKLIFETCNDVRTKVRWKVEKTGPEIRLRSHGGNSGICTPLVAHWLQRSIPLGHRGVRFASELCLGARNFRFVSELRAAHLKGIIQSAFWEQRSAFGVRRREEPFDNTLALFETYGLHYKNHIERAGGLDLIQVCDKVSSEYGHFALNFMYRDDGDLRGHCIGFYHGYQIFHMFDPNIGLLEYSNENSFREHIQFIFSDTEKYRLPLQDHPSNCWVLITLDTSP